MLVYKSLGPVRTTGPGRPPDRHQLRTTSASSGRFLSSGAAIAHPPTSAKKQQNPVFPEKDEVCVGVQKHRVEPIRFELTTSSLQS